MVDPIAAVLAVLKADADVAALAANRVFGGEVPRTEVEHMPRAAVVVSGAGGPGGYAYMDFAKVRIDVDCYAATPRDAWLLHLAVRTKLKHLRRTHAKGVLIHSADVSADGSSGVDPETDWPVTVSSYLLSVAEIAVDAA